MLSKKLFLLAESIILYLLFAILYLEERYSNWRNLEY